MLFLLTVVVALIPAAHAHLIYTVRSILGWRVESRSGAVELGSAVTVSDPFGWSVSEYLTVLPFPDPAHQTGCALSRIRLSDKGLSALAHGEARLRLRSSR
jgi:hypothetical protein